ncbi:hypothetical protein BFL35_08300 [Clavibacter michiganensis]|nr:hypothetical protein BFL35_08300 [Clavibacter michiganensis]
MLWMYCASISEVESLRSASCAMSWSLLRVCSATAASAVAAAEFAESSDLCASSARRASSSLATCAWSLSDAALLRSARACWYTDCVLSDSFVMVPSERSSSSASSPSDANRLAVRSCPPARARWLARRPARIRLVRAVAWASSAFFCRRASLSACASRAAWACAYFSPATSAALPAWSADTCRPVASSVTRSMAACVSATFPLAACTSAHEG